VELQRFDFSLSKIRVISGKAKGCKLQLVPGEVTRPITDRVKESLFNIIGRDIQQSNFLDLFAGTGSVGIEALSRGAAYARFLDNHRLAIRTIKTNLGLAKVFDRAEVTHIDAFIYLNQSVDKKYDYIFIAPPQYKKLWKEALLNIDSCSDWISEDGWVIVQIDPVEDETVEFQNLYEFDRRKYGNSLLLFYTLK